MSHPSATPDRHRRCCRRNDTLPGISQRAYPDAAERAGQVIARQLLLLEGNPAIGRPIDAEHTLRELVVSFGDSGYVALYRHEEQEDAVFTFAFRHQREAGY